MDFEIPPTVQRSDSKLMLTWRQVSNSIRTGTCNIELTLMTTVNDVIMNNQYTKYYIAIAISCLKGELLAWFPEKLVAIFILHNTRAHTHTIQWRSQGGCFGCLSTPIAA